MNKNLKEKIDEELPHPAFLDDLPINLHLVSDEKTTQSINVNKLLLRIMLHDIPSETHFLEQVKCYNKNFLDVACLTTNCQFNFNICVWLYILKKGLSNKIESKID